MLALTLSPRHLHRWLPGYAKAIAERIARPRYEGPRHVLFALCDHYEPLWGGASPTQGKERVDRWEREYPALANEFRDADGRPPRHSFFFPGEQYAPSYLDSLGRLARYGLGEVELHLHHEGDDAHRLERSIRSYLRQYGEHGHLTRGPDGTPSSTATGASPTRAATDATAESTRSCGYCSRRVATPTTPSRPRRTRRSRAS